MFIVDAPHGGGKIPVMPNYVVSMSPTHTVLRNCEGMFVSYPEPNMVPGEMPTTQESTAPGVWDLLNGKATAIYPATSSRLQRRKQHRMPDKGRL
jgi:lysine 2,3-aminomutase